MNPYKLFYNLLSITFTIWSTPLMVTAILLLGDGITAFITASILFLIALLLIDIVFPLTEEGIPDSRITETIPFLEEVPEPQIVIAVFLVVYFIPFLIHLVTMGNNSRGILIRINNWSKISIENIKQTVYQTIFFDRLPARNKVTIESSHVNLSFTSMEDVGDWLSNLDKATEENPCGLCNPSQYYHTRDERHVDALCDDCLKDTLKQLPENEDLEVTEELLVSRI